MRTVRARLAMVGAGILLGCCVSGAASSAPHVGLETTTLVSVPDRISAFAQDGPRLAWCGRGVRVLDLRTRRSVAVDQPRSPGCEGLPGTIAIAGARVVWEAVIEEGNSFVAVDAVTAATNDRRNRNLGEFWIAGKEDEWSWPLLTAGDDSTLVYYSACNLAGNCHRLRNDVRRVVGRKARRLFDVALPRALVRSDVADVSDLHPRVLALAAAGTRVAVLEDLHPCPCNLGPQWSPDGKTIAWSRQGIVYVMNADGSGERRISPVGHGEGSTGPPLWSPDGTRLAYEYDTFRRREVHLVNADGSGHRRLTPGGKPTWSPSGRKLSFVRNSDVWTIDADGSGARRLTSDQRGTKTAATWSPDGATLAAVRAVGKRCAVGLYLIRADGGGKRRIAGTKECYPTTPRWSPRGDRIAFRDRGSIVVVNADGSGRLGLAKGGFAPVWSPDGRRIVFSTLRLFVVSSTGGVARPVTPQNMWAGSPAWSPDGRTIVFDADAPFDHDRFRNGVYSVAPDGSGLKKLAPDDVTGIDLRDARTGTRVASFLTPGGAYVMALSRAYLALLVRTPGRPDELRVYRPQSGALVASTLLPASRNDYSPQLAVTADGIVVFRVGRSIRAFDARTKVVRRISAARTTPAGFSVDGRRLAWVEYRRGRSVVRAVVLPARLP